MSEKKLLIKKALKLAEKHHKNQTDKAGKDYFKGHIMQVFKNVGGYNAPREIAITAILHDSIEDTDIDPALIENHFGGEVLDAILILSRSGNEPYTQYIKRIKQNPIATKVKLADLEHNSDLSRIDDPDNDDVKRNNKYKNAIDLLKT